MVAEMASCPKPAGQFSRCSTGWLATASILPFHGIQHLRRRRLRHGASRVTVTTSHRAPLIMDALPRGGCGEVIEMQIDWSSAMGYFA
jgi:hypothetical protein